MQLTPWVQTLSNVLNYSARDEVEFSTTSYAIGDFLTMWVGQNTFRHLTKAYYGFYGAGANGTKSNIFSSDTPLTTYAWDEFDYLNIEWYNNGIEAKGALISNNFCIYVSAGSSIQFEELEYLYAAWSMQICRARYIIGDIPPRLDYALSLNSIMRLDMPTNMYREGYPYFEGIDKGELMRDLAQAAHLQQSNAGLLPPN